MRNIVLIGFRGTGKSSVAELVAMATHLDVIHMDEEIVRRAGCSIPGFVHSHGWEAFWDIESQVAENAASMCGMVIDTGGGVIRREQNMAHLKAHGDVFWLTAPAHIIKERIKDDGGRPSITGEKSFLDEVDEVLEVREPLYAQYADHVIDTDGRTLGEIAQSILDVVCG